MQSRRTTYNGSQTWPLTLLKPINTIPGISDHNGIVVADFYLRAFVNKRPPHSIPLWSRANCDAMKESTNQFAEDFDRQFMSRSIKQNWQSFAKHMKSMLHQHVPIKKVGSRHHLPWMNTTLHRMRKKKGQLYTKAKKTGVGWEKFVECQKATQMELKTAHWQYINGVLVQGLAEGDQKPFWRYIRSQRQNNQGVSPLRSGSQLLFSDALTIARLPSEQFSSVFTKDTPETADIQLQGPQYHPLEKLVVTEAEVCKLLKNLNSGKPDEIPTRLLKTLADKVLPVVTNLIRQSLSTGRLPSTQGLERSIDYASF